MKNAKQSYFSLRILSDKQFKLPLEDIQTLPPAYIILNDLSISASFRKYVELGKYKIRLSFPEQRRDICEGGDL